MKTLALDNVGYRVGEHWLVRDCSFTVAPGELTVLVGPNGAGKSTILKLLSGLWTPTEGGVSIDGVDLFELDRPQIARQISIVLQDTRLDHGFTVEEVVAMGRLPHLSRFGKLTDHDHELIENALRRTDVAGLRHRSVNTLSGGEKQRVMLARSLATEAECILLDEPTASLDGESAEALIGLCVDELDGGRALVLVAHDAGLWRETLGDRLASVALEVLEAESEEEGQGREAPRVEEKP